MNVAKGGNFLTVWLGSVTGAARCRSCGALDREDRCLWIGRIFEKG